MIIRCPKCKTGYNVPEQALLPNGRTVRCKNCGHTWHAVANNPEEPEQLKTAPVAPAATEEPLDKAVAAEERLAQKGRRTFVLIVCGILLITTALLMLFKEQLAKFSILQPLYQLTSSHSSGANTLGVIIPPESVERTLQEGEPLTLTFKGTIINTNAYPIKTPKIVVSLHDERGVEIDRWPAYVGQSDIAPGASVTWICRFFNPDLARIYEHRVVIE